MIIVEMFIIFYLTVLVFVSAQRPVQCSVNCEIDVKIKPDIEQIITVSEINITQTHTIEKIVPLPKQQNVVCHAYIEHALPNTELLKFEGINVEEATKNLESRWKTEWIGYWNPCEWHEDIWATIVVGQIVVYFLFFIMICIVTTYCCWKRRKMLHKNNVTLTTITNKQIIEDKDGYVDLKTL